MEVGGVGPERDAVDARAGRRWTGLRDAAVLHYELFPYLYGLLQAQPARAPPARLRLSRTTRGSWSVDLRAARRPRPARGARRPGRATTPTVYLPPGSWVDLYTGATVKGGGASFTRATPLDQFPLYARAGAVVPFNLRTATALVVGRRTS